MQPLMPQSADAVWTRAKMLLREKIPERTVDNWLQEVDPKLGSDSGEEATIILRVPSSFSREYLLSRFREKIADALNEATDVPLSLELAVDEEAQLVAQERTVPSGDRGSSTEGLDGYEEGSPKTSERAPTKGSRTRSSTPSSLGRDAGGERLDEEKASPPSEVSSEDVPRDRQAGPTHSKTDRGSRTQRRESPRESGKKRGDHSNLFKASKLKQNLRSKFTFSEFVTGESNRLAHDTSFSVAREPGRRKYNPLFLFGDVGLGKTHLAQAIAHHAIDHDSVGAACYLSSERFTSEFVTAIREDALNEFSTFYRSVDLLVVDDIQFLEGKEKTQEEFFHLFNDLHQSGKQIVLCADEPPVRITGMEERLTSRFQWGLTAEFQRPSFEMRVELLRRKAEDVGLDLKQAILEVIADSITENVRQLEGALKQLSAHSKLQEGRLEMSDAKRILGNSVGVRAETRQPSIQDIIHVVAEHYSLAADELISRGRHRAVSDARQVAMYLARQLTGRSYASIGRRFGGRDHSTVIHACNKVKDRTDVQEGFEDELESIRTEVQAAVRA